MRNVQRTGFTLIELLVCIGIIGILIALLLPAVQAAREAGRRAQCASNLRQIGLAVQNYADVNGCLPPGACFHDWNRDFPGGPFWQNGSVTLILLPYVEQQRLYDKFNFDLHVRELPYSNVNYPVNPITPPANAIGPEWQLDERGVPLRAHPIPVYVCPSDETPAVIGDRGKFNYLSSDGPAARENNPSAVCDRLLEFNARARAPYNNPRNFPGPFHRQGQVVRFREITDGLARTIFFGETLPACSHAVIRGWAATNNVQGFGVTIVPINFDSCHQEYGDMCRTPYNYNAEFGFKSRHPGVCGFLFGDGSVHYLTQDLDMDVYQLLGDKADGAAVDF